MALVRFETFEGLRSSGVCVCARARAAEFPMSSAISSQILRAMAAGNRATTATCFFRRSNKRRNVVVGGGRPTSLPASMVFSLLPFRSAFRHHLPAAFCCSAMGGEEKVAPVADAADAGMDAVQRRLMFEDECILVDEQDNIIGHDSKYNCHLMEKIESGSALHRAFSVFLFNSKYELLLQQRSATKVTFPKVWTNTCCSHPLYRESELIEENSLGVRNAAQRKLFDELGIPAEDLPVDWFTPLGRMLYKAPSDGKWGEHELDYLLFVVKDVRLHPNPDEVANVKYFNRDQLKELLRKADAKEDGVTLSPWFRLVVDNFLFKWWDHVERGTLQEVAHMKSIHKLV